MFPRNNHHGQLQPSFVFDALQCGGGGLQQQLATVQRHLPHALSNAAALQVRSPHLALPPPSLHAPHLTSHSPPLPQRFPSFFPWLSSCAPRTP